MLCRNCGSEIVANSRFCSHCGTEVGSNQVALVNTNAMQEAERIKNEGDVYLNQQNYHKAIGIYNRAIKICPDYPNAYNNRGMCYSQLGEHDIAIEDYNKVLMLDPDFYKTYINRATAYCLLEDYDHALLDCQKALQLNAPNTDEINKLIRTIAEMKHDDKILGFLGGVGEFAKNFAVGFLQEYLNDDDDD